MQGPSNRAALRAFVVIALSLLVLGYLPRIFDGCGRPLGVFGYQTDADGIVLFVDDNSPAARAGIHAGDRIDESSTPPQFRPYVVQGTFVWAPGQTVTFGLVKHGVLRSVTLRAILQVTNALRTVFWIVNFAAAVLFIFVGAALVLLQPGMTTWGFFFYCLAFAPGSWVSAWALPYPPGLIADILFDLIEVAGLVGVLVFALCFLSGSVGGWRMTALD